eukprot:1143857-Pelagomonas_calceolata.AAC.1
MRWTWTSLSTKALEAILRASLTVHGSQLPAVPFARMSPLTSNLPTQDRSVDLVKETLQPDTLDDVAMPAQMPEVTTSECACIYNANGNCVGMLNVDGSKTLVEAYEAAKKAGIHATIQPPVQDSATEIMGLLSRQKAQQKQIFAKSKKTPQHWFDAMPNLTRVGPYLPIPCNSLLSGILMLKKHWTAQSKAGSNSSIEMYQRLTGYPWIL